MAEALTVLLNLATGAEAHALAGGEANPVVDCSRIEGELLPWLIELVLGRGRRAGGDAAEWGASSSNWTFRAAGHSQQVAARLLGVAIGALDGERVLQLLNELASAARSNLSPASHGGYLTLGYAAAALERRQRMEHAMAARRLVEGSISSAGTSYADVPER